MGINDFSKKMFEKVFSESKRYISAIAVTMMFIFMTINISYNDVIYKNNVDSLKTYKKAASDVMIVMDARTIQNQMLLITVIVIAIFTVVANTSFLNKRSKELGFVISNGATTTEMSYYIRYMCSRCYLVAGVIGVGAGIIMTPVFNFVMYKLLGVTGNVFHFNLEAFYVSFIYLAMHYVYLMIIGVSYVYKKEIVELFSVNKAKTVTDKRQIKFPAIIYLFVYFLPFVLFFTNNNNSDMNSFIYYIGYLSIAASIGVVSLYIPKKLLKVNKRKYMYDKKRKIYINNIFVKLRNYLLYIIVVFCSINYFTQSAIEYREIGASVETVSYCLLCCCIVIGMTFMNKIIDDFSYDINMYKGLYTIGFDKLEIVKISRCENIGILISVVTVPFLILFTQMALYMKVGNFSTYEGIKILGISFIPVLIFGVIAIIINEKKLKNSLGITSISNTNLRKQNSLVIDTEI